VRAAVYHRFGGPEVVHVEEVPKPEPKAGEVLIRIRATTVSMADYRMRARDLPKGLGFLGPLVLGVFGPRRPILGMDLAGVVEAVGEGVTRFKAGDEVIGMPGPEFAAHAEYKVMRETAAIALKPKNLDFAEAVSIVFGGQPALVFLRRAGTKAGDEVLINGASGSVGTAAVMIAKGMGATVTGVCSGPNAELVRSLGADHVIDYRTEDFAAGGKQYDAIMDCVGNAPFERVRGAIKPGGALLLVVADLKGMLGASGNSRRGGIRVNAAEVPPSADDLAELARLAEAGVLKPVIDRRYTLNQIVEAHRYVDTARKRGSLVVTP
jgi:NADPH:quinone reductase-like Zn-dependent oxidoreductase